MMNTPLAHKLHRFPPLAEARRSMALLATRLIARLEEGLRRMDAHHEIPASARPHRATSRQDTDARACWDEERAALLTELEAARHSAEESIQHRDELLCVIAHELRGPLNSIFGWVQLLQGGRLDGAQQTRALEAIARGTQAQTRLIEDMLEISRALGGRLQLSPSHLDAAQPLQSAVDAVIERATAKGVMLSTVIDPGLRVHADGARLRQLFGHLLDNAVRCTPQGGTIDVHLAREHDTATVRITDSGVGIEPDALAHVFEPFRRERGAAGRAAGRGLGVGLALARQIATLHGGSVEAYSEGRDRGALFVVRLPLVVAQGLDTPCRQPGRERCATDHSSSGISHLIERKDSVTHMRQRA